ncbi:MAG: rhodanese-like domain-containing protein [Methanothrix sp.]|nr:rhodanese-like domain-containing protein [Methanothrix sp.]
MVKIEVLGNQLRKMRGACSINNGQGCHETERVKGRLAHPPQWRVWWRDMIRGQLSLDEERNMKKLIVCIIAVLIHTLVAISPALAAAEVNLTGGNESSIGGAGFGDAIAYAEDISSGDVILDISPPPSKYMEGALSINYDDFFNQGGELKTAYEMADLLGHAGIKSNDSLRITGECMPCGGGPAPAFFVYWVLKYLGHEDVRVLEGDADDWLTAGHNLSDQPASRPQADYIFKIDASLLATYEFVAVGGAQIVDARPPRDYEIGSIPGSVNIPYEDLLINESLKSEEELQNIFQDLSKDRPVVVYTNVGVEATIVWFALNHMGYDARLYTWRDWLVNQPKFAYSLTEIRAFQEAAASFASNSTDGSSLEEGDDRLTVKGCVGCGFGSPQGFANLQRKNGSVQIGSSAATPATSGTDGQIEDTALHCTAVINAPDGSEAARVQLIETLGGRYAGIWNAGEDPAVYIVSIIASSNGNSETFANVLEIEVIA